MFNQLILLVSQASGGGASIPISLEQWVIIALVGISCYMLGWITLHMIHVRRNRRRNRHRNR